MQSESPATGGDLREGLRQLARQKWVVLGFFAFAALATSVATLRLPKVYDAESTLEYDSTPSRLLGSGVEDVTVSVPGGNYLLAKEWYETQNRIIGSQVIALRVVERLKLHTDPAFMNIPAAEQKAWRGASAESAARILLSQLTVKPEKGTRLVKIVISDTSPERAALLSNAVADAYLTWAMEERLGSTVKAAEWLSNQLDDLSGKLRESELLLHDFRKKNNVLSVSVADQQNVVTQTIQDFSAALTEATTHRIQVASKLAQLEKALADDPMQAYANIVARNPTSTSIRDRYQEALLERDRASTVYGPNHPQIKQLDSQLERIKDEARQEVETLLAAARRDLAEAESIESGLRDARQKAQATGIELNLHEIEYNRLERERANNERMHAILLQRTAEANLTRMLRTSPVRLIDRAVTPLAPVRPRVTLNIAAGSVLGLLAGLGLGLVRARMDRSINSPDDLTALDVHMLGLVPAIGKTKTGKFVAPQRSRGGGKRPSREAGALTKELIVHTDPQSSVAECCRTIRTNLAFMSPDRPLRTLVVTSPAPSEGKSTVAASLAITLAKGGRRVLLIDTDMRRPRLHQAFSTSARLGITSVLAGEASLEESIQATVVDDLFLLACGPIPPNPSELLHTERFSNLMAELRARFDLLLFDTPPVNVVTDAAVLGPQVDAVLMVAKAGKTSRDALSHAVRRLRDIGTNVVGCVINDLAPAAHAEYGGYSYYQGYRYSDDDQRKGPGAGNPPSHGSAHATSSPDSAA